jgi:hypothetical protein
MKRKMVVFVGILTLALVIGGCRISNPFDKQKDTDEITKSEVSSLAWLFFNDFFKAEALSVASYLAPSIEYTITAVNGNTGQSWEKTYTYTPADVQDEYLYYRESVLETKQEYPNMRISISWNRTVSLSDNLASVSGNATATISGMEEETLTFQSPLYIKFTKIGNEWKICEIDWGTFMIEETIIT